MHVVLVPSTNGLATAEVFRVFDHMQLARERMDAADLHALAREPITVIAERLENDLQQATLQLRPELGDAIEQLLGAGALGAQVSGSGPTVFGLFPDAQAATDASARIPGSLVTMVARR
jgi:4-diphosphocytidyl-2-C-methyl-D-erythritol kinase